MSSPYKDPYRKSGGNFTNILIIAFLLFVLPPVLILAFSFLLVLYFSKLKTKYSIILVVSCWLFLLLQQSILREFVLNSFVICKNVLYGLFSSHTIALAEYARYTPACWLVMALIGFSIAIYFNFQIQRNKKFENANMHGLEQEIEKLALPPAPKKEKHTAQNSTLLGVNQSGKKVFCEDDCKHVFVCGTTGSGKTVALSNFIYSAVTKNYGTLIIDGKGDVGKNSILEITKGVCGEHGKKLYVIDMNNPSASDKYNPFYYANETIAKDMLVNMSFWSEEHYKLNTERYIQRLIKLLILKFESLDFYKIVDYLPEKKFNALSLELCNADMISKEEHLKNLVLSEKSGKIAEDAAARFSTLLESSVGSLFGNDTGINIFNALQEKAVILFILNPLLFPETSSAFGKLVLIESKTAVSKLFNISETRQFFIFDEINTYATTALLNLVNKSRSANVTCILASQSLADLENTEGGESFKQQVIENCNNYLILRQNTFKSAEEWAKNIGTVERMKMTYQIQENDTFGKGSARRTHEFIIHPDIIKNQRTGQAVFVSKDTGEIEKIQVHKPF